MRSPALLFCSIALACASGCTSTYPTVRGGVFARVSAHAPLPSDEHLLDPPAKDASLLGRILPVPYDPTQPLAAQLAPNPCADALVDVEPRPLDTEIEDAARLPSSADGRSPASHVYYRFHVLERLEKAKTPAYAACCAKASCGTGYVRGLSFAEGEIARGTPTAPGGHANVALDDDGPPLELTLLERHAARGYLTFTLETPGVTPHEEPAAPPPSAKHEAERLEVRELPQNADLFKICTKSRCLTENQFVILYQKQTGSHELDDFVRDRWANARWEGASFGGVFGALATTGGAVMIATAQERDTQKGRDLARVGGGMLTGIGLLMLTAGVGFLISPSDGATTDHYLTKLQTRRFVERYNRALPKDQ
jgi:hypothetical protein